MHFSNSELYTKAKNKRNKIHYIYPNQTEPSLQSKINHTQTTSE